MSNGKILKIKFYLEDSWNFYNRAIEEIEKGIKENDNYKIRDAAEKLWNAIIQASNALILYYLDIVPSSHWERRKLLEKLEEMKPEIERYGFRDRYAARERYLHELTFYEGIIDIDLLKIEVKKVRKYIEDVENLIKLS